MTGGVGNGVPAEAAERMRRAIGAVATGNGSRDELEAAARQLVTELRRRRLPPEQALLRIKEILAEAGLRATYASPPDGAEPTALEATVYRDVIAWSIRHYYEKRD